MGSAVPRPRMRDICTHAKSFGCRQETDRLLTDTGVNRKRSCIPLKHTRFRGHNLFVDARLHFESTAKAEGLNQSFAIMQKSDRMMVRVSLKMYFGTEGESTMGF